VAFSAGGDGVRNSPEFPAASITSFAAIGDCRTIAIYEFVPFAAGENIIERLAAVEDFEIAKAT